MTQFLSQSNGGLSPLNIILVNMIYTIIICSTSTFASANYCWNYSYYTGPADIP